MLTNETPIQTANKTISVKGKVFFNDRRRRIEVKRPILDLIDKQSMEVYYIMELCLSKEKAVERLQELAKKNVIPIILYFTK